MTVASPQPLLGVFRPLRGPREVVSVYPINRCAHDGVSHNHVLSEDETCIVNAASRMECVHL